MPVFRYVAVSPSGDVLKGERSAADTQGLEGELAQQGLHLVRARPAGGKFRLGRQRLHAEMLLQFVQEFAALLQAGLTVPEALELALRRPEAPAFEALLRQALTEVRGGRALSESLAAHGDLFDPLLIQALRTGERSGTLPAALNRYRDELRRRIELRRRVVQAMAYPMFLLLALVVGLAILFGIVLPRFAALYDSFDTPLPTATRALIALVDAFPYLLAGGLVLTVALYLIWQRYATSGWILRIHLWRRRIPHIGPLSELARVSAFARSLSTLLGSGTPLLEALHALQVHERSPLVSQSLATIAKHVREGESLSSALRAENFVPESAAKLVQVGEASGGLDRMLAEIAQAQEDMLNHRLARTMALVEPLLMLIMGVIIGGVIIVMYLPIFQLATVIQ